MRSAVDLLQSGLILADGAMGTYFSQVSGLGAETCELANLDNPGLIRQIHQQYVAAGARLLRTNTFAAAALFGPGDPEKLSAVCRAGFSIAACCAGSLACVAADIGPAYNLETPDYLTAASVMMDAFAAEGAGLYILETFADPDELLPVCAMIRARVPSALIIASFALSADGRTRKGLSLRSLSAALDESPLLDIWGVNCGIGPAHLTEHLRQLPQAGKPLSLMPNNGYPRLENQRLIYGSSPEYFAQAARELAGGRTRIIGGCCGTTPRHIKALRLSLDSLSDTVPLEIADRPASALQPEAGFAPEAAAVPLRPVSNHFSEKIARGEFVIAVELDPPPDGRMAPMIHAAQQLSLAGVDLLTLADSPLSRVKMDPVACAARLHRETGLPVLPHLCCRDRNANALRSILLAAYSEGIRQVLAITGDAIPESDRGYVKPVFNMNSVGLLQMIRQMNDSFFPDDPIQTAAALDPGVANPDAELARVMRKKEQGASLLLTQPVFDTSGLDLIRKARSLGLKVLIGLMPLISDRNARYMSQEVPGIRIPADIVAKFAPGEPKDEAIGKGIRLACETAAAVRSEADGFYLIAPFNRADLIVRLVDGLRRDGLLHARSIN